MQAIQHPLGKFALVALKEDHIQASWPAIQGWARPYTVTQELLRRKVRQQNLSEPIRLGTVSQCQDTLQFARFSLGWLNRNKVGEHQ